MRFADVSWLVLCLFAPCLFIVTGCNAQAPASDEQAQALTKQPPLKDAPKDVAADTKPQTIAATKIESASKKAFAPLGKPKPVRAALGKPKFALRNSTPSMANVDPSEHVRATEVKRLIDAYHNMAIRYVEDLATAPTQEARDAIVVQRKMSAASVRSIARLLGHIVIADPSDPPALDALIMLSKYHGSPVIDTALAKSCEEAGTDEPFDLMAMLLEHHASDPKIIDACRRLPRGDATDEFLAALFGKTFNPNVRWSAGAQLISSLRRNERSEEMEQVVVAMSEDRYLEGVPVGSDSNAREWAIAKLREIHVLGVGNPLPIVSGNKLDGSTGSISDYKGKVVILDVWTTWCGPCVQMIPHEIEIVERLEGKPFAILSVSCDREQETLVEFLKERPMPWDHWWVEAESEFKKALNIASFPTIFVLDGKGVIRHKNIRGEELDKAVDELIAEIEDNS